MIKTLKSTVVGALAVLLLGVSMSATAGFTGVYAPANWSLATGNVTVPGSVNTSAAPGSITLTDTNTAICNNATTCPVTTLQYSNTATTGGHISFSWSYFTSGETPVNDNGDTLYRAGYFDNSVKHFLTADACFPSCNDASSIQVGFGSFDVVGGDLFGFFIDTFSNIGGNTTLAISNFNFETTQTTNVPEPGTLALLGLGLVGIAAMRKRKPV